MAAATAMPAFPRTGTTGTARPMRLGGPTFLNSDDPGEQAREHRRLGYRAAYAPKVDLKDKDRIRASSKNLRPRMWL